MADFNQARNKRGITISAIVVVIGILIGNIMPPIAVFLMKLLPNGAQTDAHFVSEDSTVLNLWALLDPNKDPAAASTATCVDLPTPGCTHLEGPAELAQIITTSSTDKFMETNVDSLMRVIIGGEPYAEVEDHHRLNRDSSYPVTEPVATKLFTIPPLNSGVSVPAHTLEGLQYFFPFETERRSYQYADPIVWELVPLDYVDPVEVNGVRAYKFHAEVPPSSLIESILDAYSGSAADEALESIARLSPVEQFQLALGLDDATAEGVKAVTEGPAERFFSPEEMERFEYAEGQQVRLQPYYEATRTFFVEPKTGTVLDHHVDVDIFFAENNLQARAISEENLRNPVRTIFSADFAFDEATQQAQLDVATPQMARIRALQAVSLVANVTTIAALVVLAWLLVRRRRHRATLNIDEAQA